jgi:hypothetical protein
MADFSALKTAIQTYIKQNGNEEIKGEILQNILLSVVTTLGDSAINDLVTALANEVRARQNADGTLQQNITNEATARGNADTALDGRIDDEATARANGDMALSNRLGSTITAENTAADQIGAEAEARAAADTALQELIDGITENIANGYVYAGIATPSSTPVMGKVFYLALTAGTYTNFGSTEVSQGINILKYNGSAWSLDAFVGIDDTPTPNSPNLVKSGGAFDSVMTNGSAFDISAHFASGGTLATYADLDAALAALNTLSASYKKGGMSIKFVQSSNKYVQYRLTSKTFTTTESNWQKQGAEVSVLQNTLMIGNTPTTIYADTAEKLNDTKFDVFGHFNFEYNYTSGWLTIKSDFLLEQGVRYILTLTLDSPVSSIVYLNLKRSDNTDRTSTYIPAGETSVTLNFLQEATSELVNIKTYSTASYSAMLNISKSKYIVEEINGIKENINSIEEELLDIPTTENASEDEYKVLGSNEKTIALVKQDDVQAGSMSYKNIKTAVNKTTDTISNLIVSLLNTDVDISKIINATIEEKINVLKSADSTVYDLIRMPAIELFGDNICVWVTAFPHTVGGLDTYPSEGYIITYNKQLTIISKKKFPCPSALASYGSHTYGQPVFIKNPNNELTYMFVSCSAVDAEVAQGYCDDGVLDIYTSSDGITFNLIQEISFRDSSYDYVPYTVAGMGAILPNGKMLVPAYKVFKTTGHYPMTIAGYFGFDVDDMAHPISNWIENDLRACNESALFLAPDFTPVVAARTGLRNKAVWRYVNNSWEKYYGDNYPAPLCQVPIIRSGKYLIKCSPKYLIERMCQVIYISSDEGIHWHELISLGEYGSYSDIRIENDYLWAVDAAVDSNYSNIQLFKIKLNINNKLF